MSKRIEIKVPDIGDFTEVPVIELLVAKGDRVAEDQSLLTLESDKATMEVPSPASGEIVELSVAVGDEVSEGDLVAVLEAEESEADDSGDEEAASENGGDDGKEADETDAASESPEAAATEQDSEPADEAGRETDGASRSRGGAESELDAGPRQSPPVPMDAGATMPDKVPYASPAIRAFARELGVDLLRVNGTGRKGRIQREDVADFVKSVMRDGARAGGGGLPFDLPDPPDVDFSKFGEVERQPLSRIRRISGKNLHRNWLSIPHVTHHDKADITAMERLRKRKKAAVEEQGFKLTPLVFLIKASVAALKQFPEFNASLDADGEHLLLKKYFHIGIAVDTDDGLVVPVLRDCDQKSVLELARELGEVSERARNKQLKPRDWQGACFTISSLGGIGGTAFNPIINAPEVAILGVSRSRMEPVWDGESFEPRLMLPLSVSYDHRVIDGATAARFTRYLAEYLEDEQYLVLA